MRHRSQKGPSVTPFFERAFHYGIEHRIISPECVDRILDEGSRGLMQIATHFENPNIYTGIEQAQKRMVGLVSLYLEYTSK